jgi:outer membrane murein-binding lipoprotein Lpp
LAASNNKKVVLLVVIVQSSRNDVNRLQTECKLLQGECRSLLTSVNEARSRADDAIRDANRNKVELEREVTPNLLDCVLVAD